MHVLLQAEFLVTLVVVAGVGILIVVWVGRAGNPIGDEMAQCVRQSVELLDSCAHTLDGRPLDEAAAGEVGGARWPAPAPHAPSRPPSTDPSTPKRT